MKKILLTPLFALTAVSCSVPFSSINSLKRNVTPTLQSMLTGQNDNGYTKKTTIEGFVCENEDYFHCKVNTAKRATYYIQNETALLMGNYNGTFSSINSGYKNNETGIQHFTYKGSLGLFDNINEDWTYEGQFVGDYYPTLTSLSESVVDEEWSYDDLLSAYVYIGSNSTVLQKFQYFAAPLLLEGNIAIASVQVSLANEELTIKLIDSSERLISTAVVTKGF